MTRRERNAYHAGGVTGRVGEVRDMDLSIGQRVNELPSNLRTFEKKCDHGNGIVTGIATYSQTVDIGNLVKESSRHGQQTFTAFGLTSRNREAGPGGGHASRRQSRGSRVDTTSANRREKIGVASDKSPTRPKGLGE